VGEFDAYHGTETLMNVRLPSRGVGIGRELLMARGIELLLLEMREHHHLPNMPRIADSTTTVSCLRCGDGCSVEEGPDGEALRESCAGTALEYDCPDEKDYSLQ
jgi:hypothetical protein